MVVSKLLESGLFMLSDAKLIRNNIGLYATCLGVGLFFGVIYFIFTEPKYESSLIYKIGAINSQDMQSGLEINKLMNNKLYIAYIFSKSGNPDLVRIVKKVDGRDLLVGDVNTNVIFDKAQNSIEIRAVSSSKALSEAMLNELLTDLKNLDNRQTNYIDLLNDRKLSLKNEIEEKNKLLARNNELIRLAYNQKDFLKEFILLEENKIYYSQIMTNENLIFDIDQSMTYPKYIKSKVQLKTIKKIGKSINNLLSELIISIFLSLSCATLLAIKQKFIKCSN